MAFNDSNPDRKSHRELRAHYHASLAAFAFLLLHPAGASAVLVLTAFRAVVAAHIEVLLDEYSARDEATLTSLYWELARIDQELELRGHGEPRSN